MVGVTGGSIMESTKHPGLSAIRLRAISTALSSAIVLIAAILTTPTADGQTFTVLHTFNGTDGANPYAGVIRDKAGNLYGTTLNGGRGAGNVFKLDTSGVLTTLYSFTNRPGDGASPYGNLVRDPWGNLYGTTQLGIGFKFIHGIVYRISTTGKEFKPHLFSGPPSDGSNPIAGLLRDQTGVLYGTTSDGGSSCNTGGQTGCGVVFKLSQGTETVLYNFTGSANGDGAAPKGVLVRDKAGNLYGTTLSGGNDNAPLGTVFRLDITGKETILHLFNGGSDGGGPAAGLVLDQGGNLYGTTTGQTVFKIDTNGNNYSILYTFSGGADGSEPYAPVVMDKAGNLYGTTKYGGNLSCNPPLGCGVVFKLNTAGNETVLHTFSGGTDGALPVAGLTRDSAGNLYGTTLQGGTGCANGCGVVFKTHP
jgi:uncharacterized repeat protein (TIGR03803 family)